MDDRYPSTEDHQSIYLDYRYPDALRDLNRRLPLVKWLLAIPHYVVLLFLDIAAFVVVIVAWFAILVSGTCSRGMFGFVEGAIRWNIPVIAYAFTLVTGTRHSGWPGKRAPAPSLPPRRGHLARLTLTPWRAND